MAKTYFNNAIIGNSSILACLDDKGELVRFFWPHIDYPQHIERTAAGIFFTGQQNSTLWFHEDHWEIEQQYVKDTNILETQYIHRGNGIHAKQVDYVLPHQDIMVRQYEIENRSETEADLGFVWYSSCITTTPHLRNVLFDFGVDSLVHYMHNHYISISADQEVYQFQLGNNAYDSAKNTVLNGFDSIGMMPDGAMSWKLGKVKPGEKRKLNLYICAASSLKEIRRKVRNIKQADISSEYQNTYEYWHEFIKSARPVCTGRKEIDNLYKRTLLVFKLMADKKTGGLLASAEIDEEFTKCGRYAYCWGRDAAFITDALDRCGMDDAVEKFYQWAVDTQEEDGSWQQRYHMDGNLAPSWGLQIDETGTLIWGMLNHYEITKDRAFLESMWKSVQKGVEFLVNFIDEETGLPKPSFDLWEERMGEHAYSSAAVYGGIMAGTQMAKILGKPEEDIKRWENTCEQLKGAILKNLWKEDFQRFIRSVRVKLNPWGGEPSEHTTMVEVNPKGYRRDVSLEDWLVDVSLLGLAIPFGTFDPTDHRIKTTVDLIEQVLTTHGVGGIRRYEHDGYIGGNPWILTTLWVALYHIKNNNLQKANEYFEWAVKGRTQLDLLPEQISKESGQPAWVIPLTWSHAMFVLVLFALMDAGAFED